MNKVLDKYMSKKVLDMIVNYIENRLYIDVKHVLKGDRGFVLVKPKTKRKYKTIFSFKIKEAMITMVNYHDVIELVMKQIKETDYDEREL